MVLQLPRVMVFEIEECCFHRNFNAILNQTEIDCVYKGIETLEVSAIWPTLPMYMTYTVVREFFIKIGPTIVLVCLNVAILREFNVSIERKRLLIGPKFVKRHSRMDLFRKSNQKKRSKKSNFKPVQ